MLMDNKSKIIIYTSASVPNNDKPELISKCGWAYKVIDESDKGEKNAGYTMCNTSFQSEMIAVLEAMKSITDKSISVEIRSDSKVIIQILKGIYVEHVNRDLWSELKQERDKFDNMSFKWVSADGTDTHLKDVHRMAQEQAKDI